MNSSHVLCDDQSEHRIRKTYFMRRRDKRNEFNHLIIDTKIFEPNQIFFIYDATLNDRSLKLLEDYEGIYTDIVLMIIENIVYDHRKYDRVSLP